MKFDSIVMGKDSILDGSEVSVVRPNDNVIVEGCSGCGKSTSVLFPSMARMEHMNPVVSYAKEEDAKKMANYMKAKGYRTEFLNIQNPNKSTVSYDPVAFIESYEDIEALSTAIVYSVLEKTVDSFWNTCAIQLCNSLIAATLMLYENPGMTQVLNLFEKTFGSRESETDSITMLYQKLNRQYPNCYAVREFRSWRAMPEKTAGSVQATLKGALNAVFPESIRNAMKKKPQISFEELGSQKMALFIISDAAERAQSYYTNLFWKECIKQLKQVADDSPGNILIRPVRLYFDDFACTSPIDNFEKNISIFRSYGISAMLLLQSQTQLESIYGADKASVIRQNCPVQLYFPGGFDDRSVELVSKKMNLPYEEVLYAPMNKVFVMAAGRKPAVITRYDTFSSKEYYDYLESNRTEKTRSKRGGAAER